MTSLPRAFKWRGTLWIGLHSRRERPFGGTLRDGSKFVAVFSFKSLARRYAALDPDDDAAAVSTSCLDCEEALRQLLTDAQEGGCTHYVVDPVRQVADVSQGIEIAGVLGSLKQWE